MELLKKYLDIKTVKFLLVGLVNTLVGTGLMFVLYNLFSINYWISSSANYIVGSIVSYFLNKYFTFKNSEKSWKQIAAFILNILICYLVAYGVAKPVVGMLMSELGERMQGNISMMFGMGIFLVLNYLGQRIFVFKSREM